VTAARSLRLALVTAYPPSTGPLSEYGWHLVERLKLSDRVAELHVLSDRSPDAGASHRAGKLRVAPTWTFGGIDLPVAVTREARRLNVDAVWFQLHLTSSGNSRMSRFVGLAAPAVTRLMGLPTLVTLHNMLGLTDLDRTAVSAGRLDLLGARLATALVCRAHAVCVPRPEYATLLAAAYRGPLVKYVPLGTLGMPLAQPVTGGRRGILAFGHFGSNKRLEVLIQAVAELSRKRPDAHLYVGGTSSRHNPDYLAHLEARYASAGYVTFLGYVPEAAVPPLFVGVAASVLPYATTTGMSSVAVQSAMYGAPIVASDIPGFRALEREGLRMRFFDWDDMGSLVQALSDVFDQPEAVRRSEARQNLDYCTRQRMDDVVDIYLDIVDGLTGIVSRRPRVRRA
jgi:glycosyltransferase involved in cell wall biosynthesis